VQELEEKGNPRWLIFRAEHSAPTRADVQARAGFNPPKFFRAGKKKDRLRITQGLSDTELIGRIKELLGNEMVEEIATALGVPPAPS
jgi:hypothetical protein